MRPAGPAAYLLFVAQHWSCDIVQHTKMLLFAVLPHFIHDTQLVLQLVHSNNVCHNHKCSHR
jgi:hypothetical protein